LGVLWIHLYRDKKVVGVFVRFRAPLQQERQDPFELYARANAKADGSETFPNYYS
jgi:hypothetical protein